MPNRFNSRSASRFAVPGLPSGYDGKSSPSLTVPSVGVEDVDRAFFTFIDKELAMTVADQDGTTRQVPVIFTAAEKWALQKRRRALRDKNNTLILPLVTVVRTNLQQTANEDVAGRGINQQTGEIVVKRRLDKSDRAYQNLINRVLVKHQLNAAVTSEADAGQLTTDRSVGELSKDPNVADGGLMLPDKLNNVFETIVIPAPQFFTAIYEVTLWAQYTQHMTQLIEQLIASFLPQGLAWKLDTPKGYWFIATVDNNIYNAENNFEDMSTEERVIKYKFTVKVPGYILATKVPGAPVPVKRYVSSPTITFETGLQVGESSGGGELDDPFLGADDPTLPLSDSHSRRRDQRAGAPGNRIRPFPPAEQTDPDDPALKSLPRGHSPAQYKKVVSLGPDGTTVTKYVKVVNVNKFTGETVFAPGTDLGGLTIVVTDD